MRLLVAAVTIVAAAATAAARVEPTPQLVRDQTLARFFAPTTPPLVSYRAHRHLSAETRGGKMTASLDAVTALDPAGGFSFQILSEEGSSLIRHRVLEAALDAERKAVRGDDSRQSALTTDNYDFLAVSPSDSLVKVDIRPRRKQVTLVDGSLFLKPDNSQLVRLEGDLSARPSFWTRKVRVVREYAEITGVHVPVSMRSVADVLIVGASTFEMTYQYDEINGQAVRGPR
ncbi:MAG TPA: hypothetical protein VLT86_07210 [Vicinamibacterales bacterium]|nr:hypothetical protein [Vicinamibacterales bacterium]